jgi:hypothetical protein
MKLTDITTARMIPARAEKVHVHGVRPSTGSDLVSSTGMARTCIALLTQAGGLNG